MQRLSKQQRISLEAATAAYEKCLDLARFYLTERGITHATAVAARLGVVASPEEGHEHAHGRLAIPYLNRAGVASIKFRCLREHDCKAADCPKYLSVGGIESGLYGILDVDEVSDVIHIGEGEFDRLTIRQVFGQPTVGVPGSDAWKEHHHLHFASFERVLLWAHPDKAGLKLADTIRREIPMAELMRLPEGFDANKLFLTAGAGRLREIAGMQEV